MKLQTKICIVGDVLVDVSLKTPTNDLKLRMGGIIHAARCLWALDVPFAVGYFSPSYMNKQIEKYLNSLGCFEIFKLGEVIGSPYVFLVDDVKEVGDQGYEFLLRDEIEVIYNSEEIQKFSDKKYEDYLLISGNYDIQRISKGLETGIHLDVTNNVKDWYFFENFKAKFDTIFVSTSSDIFKKYYGNSFVDFSTRFEKFTNKFVLKENRGGSRGVDFVTKEKISISSQTKPIIHSVGVGDVYCASYIVNQTGGFRDALNISSWIAAEYAMTTYPDDFKTNVIRICKSNVKDIPGVSLPWEERERINIYVAAPDFDFVDTTPIDKLVNSLQYHNFKARRPIKENGQMEPNASKARRLELFTSDMVMLDECCILIAVLLYDDPGTLIEIGLAYAKGMPTIVYDPYLRASNCMLTELPSLVTDNLDEIICEVFTLSEKNKNGK